MKFRVYDTKKKHYLSNENAAEYFLGVDGRLYSLQGDAGCNDPECCGGESFSMNPVSKNFKMEEQPEH